MRLNLVVIAELGIRLACRYQATADRERQIERVSSNRRGEGAKGSQRKAEKRNRVNVVVATHRTDNVRFLETLARRAKGKNRPLCGHR